MEFIYNKTQRLQNIDLDSWMKENNLGLVRTLGWGGRGGEEVPLDNIVEETGAFFHEIALHHFPPIREVSLG